MSDAPDPGTVAPVATPNAGDAAKVVTEASSAAGAAAGVASAEKYRAHKENPQQVPIG